MADGFKYGEEASHLLAHRFFISEKSFSNLHELQEQNVVENTHGQTINTSQSADTHVLVFTER
jgi:hypothetical protein